MPASRILSKEDRLRSAGQFLAGCQPGEQLWSFSARWPGDWRGEEQREGYVRVRLTGPGPAFETVRRSLAEPDGGMPKAQAPLPKTRRWAWWQPGPDRY